MKLTIVLLTTMLTCAYATGLSQSVTFSGKDVPLKQVFTAIENQTGYVVFSNRNTLDDAKKVSITATDMPLADFLHAVLKEQPFEFSIEGKTIVLSPKKIISLPIQLFEPPGRDVSGFILDEKNRTPIRGVTIIVNGTNKATQTDEKGAFTLKGIEGDITITLTSIGYEKKVVKIAKTTMNIVESMKVATNELDQAVVQAYGITSKRLSTGNITRVSGEELRRQPVMNPVTALQGRVPGLQVTNMTGIASSPVKLQIRGRNSINTNAITEPLYVIDGIPQTVLESGIATYNTEGVSAGLVQGGLSYTEGQSPFFNINPKDIESIEVLKDADATAIYGSRAANGVILITTRKAQPGKTALEASVQQGFVTISRVPKMLNLREYLDMRYEAFKNDGITPTPENAPDLMVWDTTRSTDWLKELLNPGKSTDLSLALSGGDQRTSFRLAGGYTDQVDLNTRSGGNKRGTVHLNVRHTSSNQKLTMSFTASYGASKVEAISDASSGYVSPPNAPPIFDESGKLNFRGYNSNSNINNYPFDYILKTNIVKTSVLNSNLSINYTLLKGLVLTGSLSYQNANNTSDIYNPMASQNPQGNPMATTTLGNTKNNNLAFEPQLNYTRSISRGKLSVLLGGTLQKTNTATGMTMGLGFTSDDLMRSIGLAQLMQTTNTFFDYKYAGVFTRINYNWENKYILNLQARRDGSSRFAPGRQFGNFGSVGASWIATEEEWLKKALPSWVSLIKLRGSYGITGSDNVGNYEYLARYSTQQPGSSLRMFTYNDVQPYVNQVPVNQDYRWEEGRLTEGGLSMAFMDDRLTVDLSVYRKRSGNQLTQLPTPAYTGFASARANWVATVQNQGVELSARMEVIRKKDFRFSMSANISRNENSLISYPGIEKSPFATRYKVGQSLATIYVLRVTGVNPLSGEYTFEDYNKDGKITTNNSVFPGTGDDDRYLAYDMNPEFFGGFGTDFRWKDFGLSLHFSYSKQIGYQAYTGLSAGRMNNLVMPPGMLEGRWRQPGDIALFPKFTTIGDNRGVELTNTSFVRMNAVEFSYSMSPELVKKAGVQACNISLNVSNLFTITRHGMDPSIRNGSFNPIPRIIVGRLTITL
ncbi:MAG: SusC/RagA family TonB-linked outer membrane protein [Pseudobacter sp.]|uniref:SusC/RagA family TonB-linked outer membrane protein n=1 Tax=Pseudobacter sp. TaxID=2045420 RepID=UPI003F7D4E09